jgi:glutamine synthetase
MGLLTLDQLAKKVQEGTIDTVITAFTDHYGRVMGKRTDADFFLDTVAEGGTHGCDYLLTTDMEMEPVPGYTYANWEKGFGDFHLIPDLSTLRELSWLEKTALVFCDVFDEKAHQPVAVAPRNILLKQLKQLQEIKLDCFAATELEYYLFENSYRQAFEKKFQDLTPAGYYLEDYHILQGTRTEHYTGAVRRHLKKSGLTVETSKGEWGLGQHEINIKYDQILKTADNHIVFKQCMKEIAESMGLSVTFMAKPSGDQAGSSSHVHLSLWKDGKNAFAGDQKLGNIECSDLFRWFLGGWISHVPDVMPFYAPTVNSYKRFVDGSWAPTRLAWSSDNRTAGFRVVGKGPSLRIECRIPGADCNPYLVLAASIASGLDGIKNKIEPPACFEGDIYAAAHLPRVPYTLAEATAIFEQSSFATEVFGAEVKEHYVHYFTTEVKAFNTSVTDWERKRYFERI